MKKIILLFLVLCSLNLLAQDSKIKKPEFVIIANNAIIDKDKLTELGKKGLVKAMNKGVSQEERDALAKKFPEQIGDREFIIKIALFTEEEARENQIKQAAAPQKTVKKRKNRYNELKLNVNDPAADFTVEMVNGEKLKLSDLKGKVILINYWATWCAPCLMEFTEFPEHILEPYKDQDFILLAISIGETKEKVAQKMEKLKKYGVNFNVGIDPTEEIWKKYASGAIPKNFLIDKDGVIKHISIGNTSGNVQKLAVAIKKLLQE